MASGARRRPTADTVGRGDMELGEFPSHAASLDRLAALGGGSTKRLPFHRVFSKKLGFMLGVVLMGSTLTMVVLPAVSGDFTNLFNEFMSRIDMRARRPVEARVPRFVRLPLAQLQKEFGLSAPAGDSGFTSMVKKQVRVAVVGAGLSGLSAAYSLIEGSGSRYPEGGAPEFNVTVFEASADIGGRSRTFSFKTEDGGTFPVDVGDAYNPTMQSFELLRRFGRAHGVDLNGPLKQRISAFKMGLTPIDSDTIDQFEEECTSFTEGIDWINANPKSARILYGALSVSQWMRFFGYSDAFLLFRIYPVVRFFSVASSKDEFLGRPVLEGLAIFTSRGATCGGGDLNSTVDWYTVAGGSQAHMRVLREKIGNHSIRTSTNVVAVRPREGIGDVEIRHQQNGGNLRFEVFDAVVMATPPDDSARLLGADCPDWLNDVATQSITCVVHSDRSMLPENDKAANMIFVPSALTKPDSDKFDVALTVLWDSIHGLDLKPRPIVTCNPEAVKQVPKLNGEVFRHRFKQVQYPSLSVKVSATDGIAKAHNDPEGVVFWAGAWVDSWHFTPEKALLSGDVAARSIGARPNPKKFYRTNPVYADHPEFEKDLRENLGKWPTLPSKSDVQ
eukprot:TRINITY_DN43643_c0_g1_i1.p1 TRINITY_DN43643_c0_g1~~TRINITY_DN43643_c0_g1_i1.p1  ORF type:complete len:640 (-),score=104.57 TRINITY_DN43643_c0_g1_i1:105-1955(-)